MEAPDRLTVEGDPRRPFVLFGLGYLGLCVAAVWLDYKVQMWRSRRRRKAARDDFSAEEKAWFKKGEEPRDDD